MVFQLLSNAFSDHSPIPPRYTCSSENISPPLQWVDPPQGTACFALIMDDPDAPAGTWVHWVFYGIPGTLSAIPEAIPAVPPVTRFGTQGKNSWGKTGYGGPCPPFGIHRYFFKLYAIKQPLPINSGLTKPELIQAMQGCMVDMVELMGTYQK